MNFGQINKSYLLGCLTQRLHHAAVAAIGVGRTEDGAASDAGVGAGTHESLLAQCPVYAEFADSQAVAIGGGP